MPTITFRNWESLEKKLRQIRQAEVSAGRNADFLFRGLSDSALPLDTTLERAGRAGIPVSKYYETICRLKPQIETFTGKVCKIPEWPAVDELLRDYGAWTCAAFPEPSAYSYMIHLRHHGFPSPLLDWTRSLYIASYFAFRSAIRPKKGKVSICMFSERPNRFKGTSSGEPQIRRIGPFVTTHSRHFLQQSDYTMCAVFDGRWCFSKHEEVFARGDLKQDVLWRFNVPWSERTKVLKLLDSYNLNAFSLFDSEESLMETLALRELEYREKNV